MSASQAPPPWLDRLAHDLRGPLTPLTTAIYLIRSDQVAADKQAELLELAERQAQRLGRMIDEIGDWARISQGRLLGRRETGEAGWLLDLALGEMRGAVAIEAAVAPEVAHAAIEGDQMRLQQLLRILVEHALAHGDGGMPEVAATCVDGRLRIDVVAAGAAPDAGPLASLLSEPQSDPQDEGLGLKLLLARAIAEAHDGRLSADAAPGNRLRLRCELPLAK